MPWALDLFGCGLGLIDSQGDTNRMGFYLAPSEVPIRQPAGCAVSHFEVEPAQTA